MPKRKLIGTILIAAPILGFFIVVSGYAITSFVATAMIDTGVDVNTDTLNILSKALGWLGIASVLGIFTSIPIGVYLLTTVNRQQRSIHEPVALSEIPATTPRPGEPRQ